MSSLEFTTAYFIRDNLLRSLPSELVYLESLKKIDLMGNKELISPPADDLPLGVEDLKSYLSRRLDRADAFLSCVSLYYTGRQKESFTCLTLHRSNHNHILLHIRPHSNLRNLD